MTMAFSSACRGVAPRTTYTVLVLVVVFFIFKGESWQKSFKLEQQLFQIKPQNDSRLYCTASNPARYSCRL